MLEHLSSKFRAEPAQREPRAAIILNRFTRTLTIMYATDAINIILGVTAEQFKEKSFYECIQENCLPDAIRCLESAKANDSIAYLRFWYRDPRRAEDLDEEMRQASVSSDSENGGVELHGHMKVDAIPAAEASGSGSGSANEGGSALHSSHETSADEAHGTSTQSTRPAQAAHTSSGESSTDIDQNPSHVILDGAQTSRSSTSSILVSPGNRRRVRPAERAAAPPPVEPFEIEAVVSCTSDGLVVVLRRARPIIPAAHLPQPAPVPMYPNGLFAAPWGANPIRPHQYQPEANNPFIHGFEAPVVPAGGPPSDALMNSIREVGVFAWSLAGINGNIASYGRGVPQGEAQPPAGLPIWDPYAQPVPEFAPPVNQAEQRWIRRDQSANQATDNKIPFQHPGENENLGHQNGFGNGGLMGSAPPGSVHQHLRNLGGYAYQGPGNYELNQYGYFFGCVQGQQGASAGPLAGNTHPPTTQPQDPSPGPSEGSQANRNLWY